MGVASALAAALFVGAGTIGSWQFVRRKRSARAGAVSKFVLYISIVQAVLSIASLAIVFEPLGPLALFVWVYAQTAFHLYMALLARPALRHFSITCSVNMVAMWFFASLVLSTPLLIATAVLPLPSTLLGCLIAGCYVLAAIGVVQSLRASETDVCISLPSRAPASSGEGTLVLRRGQPCHGPAGQGLRVIQLTDTHLGSFMSVDRLRRICERVVERAPDLVLLTGDFLTVESQCCDSYLHEALSPLARLPPNTAFACYGNHDHESPGVVRRALNAHNITLLVDQEVMGWESGRAT